jgi:hypothetical protein
MAGLSIPGGQNKGQALTEAATKDIQYWIGRIEKDLAADPSKKFADKDRAWLKGAREIVAARNGGGPQPQAPRPQQALAQRPEQSTALVEGSFGDPKRVTAALAQAAENYHLVSPASVCGTLPEGCEVCLSLVHISPEDKGLYKVGDKLGLDRVMLSQIAAAAGATVTESKRLDDGSHPHYCAWAVTIAFRLFDGQLVERTGNVEIDVREPDGAAYVDIVSKNEKPEKQLLELRKFLTRHAESKAMNRAIAAMGIRRSYTKAELAKPFAVARLMFTGRSADPETRQQFNAAIAQSFLGGRQQLFGQPPQLHGANSAGALPTYHPPPQRSYDPEPYDTDYELPSEPAASRAPSEPPPAQPAQSATNDGYDRGADPNNY